jgi:hypothetical protein
VAKAPINSLSRVRGTLSPITNVDLKIKPQLLLDCGYSTNLLGLHTVEKMNVKLEDASNVKLFNAAGEEMSVRGQSEIMVRIRGWTGRRR